MELIITEVKKKTHSTICLNMIVKNEEKIIVDTLINLCQHFAFDYWVISDTGSSDNTRELITDFFLEKGIPGELVEHEWTDFAYNRTKALECAFNKTDYLLTFDADDRINGDLKINLPLILTKDAYNLKIGQGIEYNRPLLITNRKRWCFKGVLHEFLSGIDVMSVGSETITGNYYIISGRFGTRSQNPNKYMDDALVLKKAFEKEMNDVNGDKRIADRYAFYCAQSYKDAGSVDEAICWYTKVLELNNWTQEKYCACILLGQLYNGKNEKEQAVRYWLKSVEYDAERIEGIVPAMEYYRIIGENFIVNMLYHRFKTYSKSLQDKLFIDQSQYNDLIEYNNSICAYYVNDKQTGYDCCKQIIMNNKIAKHLFDSTLSSVMFYKDYIEKDIDQTLHKRLLALAQGQQGQQGQGQGQQAQAQGQQGQAQGQAQESCRTSKNILFYTGFSFENWNYSYMSKKALGGSEKSVAYLSTYFPDYTIYVSGGVENEEYANVTYLHHVQLQELINKTQFHTIICSRYIAFFEMYKNIAFSQFYIWAHDTELIHSGCDLTSTQIITKWHNSINGCICQTKWHAEEYKKLYPELKDKIHIINNGIESVLFPTNNKKQVNKFIYTSRVERGLKTLLGLWSQILDAMPDATLIIASYELENEEIKQSIVKYRDSITHLGKLTTDKLYEAMSTSEYWLYPTQWHETSCITALEMLANGVICIFYPVAGLVDTIKEYGIPVQAGNEIVTITNLTNKQKMDLRKRGTEYALNECSWAHRTEEWRKVLFQKEQQATQQQKQATQKSHSLSIHAIKIINLKRRDDRKTRMIAELSKHTIPESVYEFIDAVDGRILEPTIEIKNMFMHLNTGYRRGVIGCALSHLNLWKRLVDDTCHEYYLIMEDDITLCQNFEQKMHKMVEEMKNKDLIFFGYHRYTKEDREIVKQDILNNYESILSPLDRSSTGGGTFCYSINKKGAQKYIEYINKHGIKQEIDWLMINDFAHECYGLNPPMATSPHPHDGMLKDMNMRF